MPSLKAAVDEALTRSGASQLLCTEPGEYRLLAAMRDWQDTLSCDVHIIEDSRFLSSRADFEQWAEGRKQLRMEYFYREMRKRYGILLDLDGSPEGGKWNYDADNRKGWRNQVEIPVRQWPAQSSITEAVITEVNAAFPNNPGDLSQFYCAVTPDEAQQQFQWSRFTRSPPPQRCSLTKQMRATDTGFYDEQNHQQTDQRHR